MKLVDEMGEKITNIWRRKNYKEINKIGSNGWTMNMYNSGRNQWTWIKKSHSGEMLGDLSSI